MTPMTPEESKMQVLQDIVEQSVILIDREREKARPEYSIPKVTVIRLEREVEESVAKDAEIEKLRSAIKTVRYKLALCTDPSFDWRVLKEIQDTLIEALGEKP